MLLFYLPAHNPANRLSTRDPGKSLSTLDNWYFSHNGHDVAHGISWAVLVLGVIQLAIGSIRRTGRLGFCRACNAQVIARHRFFSWRCERCGNKIKF